MSLPIKPSPLPAEISSILHDEGFFHECWKQFKGDTPFNFLYSVIFVWKNAYEINSAKATLRDKITKGHQDKNTEKTLKIAITTVTSHNQDSKKANQVFTRYFIRQCASNSPSSFSISQIHTITDIEETEIKRMVNDLKLMQDTLPFHSLIVKLDFLIELSAPGSGFTLPDSLIRCVKTLKENYSQDPNSERFNNPNDNFSKLYSQILQWEWKEVLDNRSFSKKIFQYVSKKTNELQKRVNQPNESKNKYLDNHLQALQEYTEKMLFQYFNPIIIAHLFIKKNKALSDEKLNIGMERWERFARAEDFDSRQENVTAQNSFFQELTKLLMRDKNLRQKYLAYFSDALKTGSRELGKSAPEECIDRLDELKEQLLELERQEMYKKYDALALLSTLIQNDQDLFPSTVDIIPKTIKELQKLEQDSDEYNTKMTYLQRFLKRFNVGENRETQKKVIAHFSTAINELTKETKEMGGLNTLSYQKCLTNLQTFQDLLRER